MLTLLSYAGSHILFPGVILTHVLSNSLGHTASTSVIANPGETAFTRAKSAHSTARHLARCTAAALLAQYVDIVCGIFTMLPLMLAVKIRLPFPVP